jgi:hypothetical protein
MSVLELLDQINELDINPDEINLINAKLEVLKNKIALQSKPYESTIKFLQSIAIDNPDNIIVSDEDLY